MSYLRMFSAAYKPQSNHELFVGTGMAGSPSYGDCMEADLPTNFREAPTAKVSRANHSTVIRWFGGGGCNKNRLKKPIQKNVRLRKRNNGMVETGEAFSSTLTF